MTPSEEPPSASPWSGRHVLVGVTGGVACFKTATLVSYLVQCGAAVQVAMTKTATRFVTPLTFSSLSGRAVFTSMWQMRDQQDSQHVEVARWANLMIIAPVTANTMAKLAAGLCDDTVSLLACALRRDTPVLLAPAMNEQMWQHPLTQRNVRTLQQSLGYQTVGPEVGWQACRTKGAGRMSEPQAILEAAVRLLANRGEGGEGNVSPSR